MQCIAKAYPTIGTKKYFPSIFKTAAALGFIFYFRFPSSRLAGVIPFARKDIPCVCLFNFIFCDAAREC